MKLQQVLETKVNCWFNHWLIRFRCYVMSR
jgi:hypothetical protein